jgi:hypothetical protein
VMGVFLIDSWFGFKSGLTCRWRIRVVVDSYADSG